MGFLTFSRKHYYKFFWFFAWWWRPTLCNIWPRISVSKKNNPGISRGLLSVKNRGFSHCCGNVTINSFDFLHDARGQNCATFGLGVQFQKNIPGISRGLSVKKSGVLTFFWKCYNRFFWFLHDNRGQHCAASGLGVQSQKV